jgi:hypothetical protein
MCVWLRWFTCSAALALVLSGLEATNPGWLSQLGPALYEFQQLRARLVREHKQEDQLSEQSKQVLRSCERKSQLAADVIAERLSLQEAAAQFRELAQTAPASHLKGLHLIFPGCSDEECFCREVIACVEAQFFDRPDKASGLIARLSRELDQELACSGIPFLPVPPPIPEEGSMRN